MSDAIIRGGTSGKPTCFIISPIGKDGTDARKNADQVLKHLIRKSLGDAYEIKRGDEESNPGSITAQIIQSILEADLIVADLSGYNPNVYYEVAVAHGYDRPTVHIQRADESPAFDLKDMRLIQYNLQDPDELEKSQKALSEFARFLKKQPASAKTPLADARGFVQISNSEDPVAQSNAEIIDQLRSLRSEVKRALRLDGATAETSVHSIDIVSMRKTIERAARRDALLPSDFDSVITPLTSGSFDNWARDVLGQVTGESDRDALNTILYDAELLMTSASVGEEPPPGF